MNTTDYSQARPSKVSNAVVILYITMGMGVVRAAIEGAPNAAEAIVVLPVLGSMWWLVTMISRRRNWARVTFLVMFLLGLLPFIGLLLLSFSISPASGLLGLVQLVLQMTALTFLFQQEASIWFRHRVASKEPLRPPTRVDSAA